MGKEEWLRKFETWQPRVNREHKDKIKPCKNFERGMNGYCKNYIGCKMLNRTCAIECIAKCK